MRARFLICLLVAGLAGCVSPRERCIAAAWAEARALDAEIAERRAAVARGYRLTPATQARTALNICAWPREPVLFCTTHTVAQPRTRVAVDPAEEQRAIARMAAHRAALADTAAAQAASCPP